jgi:hypothetical protein
VDQIAELGTKLALPVGQSLDIEIDSWVALVANG